jgi:hypothetical protein
MFRVLILAASLGGLAHASLIAPITYSMANGNTGSKPWLDLTYSGTSPMGNDSIDGAALFGGLGELTDGMVGQSLLSGTEAGWVGWTRSSVTITFDFGSIQNFSDAQFYSANTATPGSGIYLWQSAVFQFSNDGVTYGSTITRNTTAGEQADTTSRYIDTTLNSSGRYAQVTFNRGGGPWIFISEAQFFTAAPEPSTAGIVLAGLALCMAVAAGKFRRAKRTRK